MAGVPLQVKRTEEIEEFTNLYFIHPISRVLVTVFAKLGVHPNVVSGIGMVMGAFAALAYFNYERWEMALVGFALMIGWHIMDGADGQLARLTGKTSELGKAMDGLVDHVSFALVYIGLTVAAAEVFGNWIWWLTVAAGASHLIQATTYEFQRQMYDYWVFGKESARPVTPEEIRAGLADKSGFSRFLGKALLANVSVQNSVAGVNRELFARLEQLKEAGEAEKTSKAYRTANLRAVKTWSIMCSNYRTIAIFIACLAKNPLYFFVFEVGFLNVALVALRMMQAGRNERLLAQLNNCTDNAPQEALVAA